MDDVLLTGGGIIPNDDMKSLNEIGVGKLFAPGNSTHEIAEYIAGWVKKTELLVRRQNSISFLLNNCPSFHS